MKTITAPAGPLTVTLINKGVDRAHLHDRRTTASSSATPKKNDVKTGTVTLAAGTYDFKCTISGHAAAGMNGKIVVVMTAAASSMVHPALSVDAAVRPASRRSARTSG